MVDFLIHFGFRQTIRPTDSHLLFKSSDLCEEENRSDSLLFLVIPEKNDF